MANKDSPIGVFDSGKGGLWLIKYLTKHLPNEEYIYYGDCKYFPWGEKPIEDVTERIGKIINFFIDQDVKLLIAACNTASLEQQYIETVMGKSQESFFQKIKGAIPDEIRSMKVLKFLEDGLVRGIMRDDDSKNNIASFLGIVDPAVNKTVEVITDTTYKTLDNILKKYIGNESGDDYKWSVHSLLSDERLPLTKSLELLQQAFSTGVCIMGTHRTIKSNIYCTKTYQKLSQNPSYVIIKNSVVESIDERIQELSKTNAYEDIQLLETFKENILRNPEDKGYIGPKIYGVKTKTLISWAEDGWYVEIVEDRVEKAIQQVKGQIRYDLEEAKIPLARISAVVPACSHLFYFAKIIEETFKEETGKEDLIVIRPDKQILESIREVLEQKNLLTGRKEGHTRFITNYDQERFDRLGEAYLKEAYNSVNIINL